MRGCSTEMSIPRRVCGGASLVSSARPRSAATSRGRRSFAMSVLRRVGGGRSLSDSKARRLGGGCSTVASNLRDEGPVPNPPSTMLRLAGPSMLRLEPTAEFGPDVMVRRERGAFGSLTLKSIAPSTWSRSSAVDTSACESPVMSASSRSLTTPSVRERR